MNLLKWFALRLQDATNALFLRRFSVGIGVLKDGSAPAVILESRSLLGGYKALVMDMKSFLTVANDMSDAPEAELESKGFVISKGDTAFLVPHWAFPRALYETLMCASAILTSLKKAEEAMESLTKMLKDGGMTQEEVDKFLSAVKGTTKPTIH